MERILNIYHYCLYLMYYYLLFMKIIPFSLLNKLPIIKRRFEAKGTTYKKSVNETFGNKEFGLSIIYGGGLLVVAIAILFSSFLILYEYLFSEGFWITNYILWGLVALSYLICYIFVFNKDEYLTYFNQFETSWGKKKRRRNVIFSFIATIMIFALFFPVCLYNKD